MSCLPVRCQKRKASLTSKRDYQGKGPKPAPENPPRTEKLPHLPPPVTEIHQTEIYPSDGKIGPRTAPENPRQTEDLPHSLTPRSEIHQTEKKIRPTPAPENPRQTEELPHSPPPRIQIHQIEKKIGPKIAAENPHQTEELPQPPPPLTKIHQTEKKEGPKPAPENPRQTEELPHPPPPRTKPHETEKNPRKTEELPHPPPPRSEIHQSDFELRMGKRGSKTAPENPRQIEKLPHPPPPRTEIHQTEIHQSDCRLHEGKIPELYCPSHRKLICRTCAVTSHRHCPNVTTSEDETKKKRDSLVEQESRKEKETAMGDEGQDRPTVKRNQKEAAATVTQTDLSMGDLQILDDIQEMKEAIAILEHTLPSEARSRSSSAIPSVREPQQNSSTTAPPPEPSVVEPQPDTTPTLQASLSPQTTSAPHLTSSPELTSSSHLMSSPPPPVTLIPPATSPAALSTPTGSPLLWVGIKALPDSPLSAVVWSPRQQPPPPPPPPPSPCRPFNPLTAHSVPPATFRNIGFGQNPDRGTAEEDYLSFPKCTRSRGINRDRDRQRDRNKTADPQSSLKFSRSGSTSMNRDRERDDRDRHVTADSLSSFKFSRSGSTSMNRDRERDLEKNFNQDIPTGPALARVLKVGYRVKRVREMIVSEEDHGHGTVTSIPSARRATPGQDTTGVVDVRWDAGGEGCYRMGRYGHYDLRLA